MSKKKKQQQEEENLQEQFREYTDENTNILIDAGESAKKRLLELQKEQKISREALDSYECKKDY